jgi:hypothetical protein
VVDQSTTGGVVKSGSYSYVCSTTTTVPPMSDTVSRASREPGDPTPPHRAQLLLAEDLAHFGGLGVVIVIEQRQQVAAVGWRRIRGEIGFESAPPTYLKQPQRTRAAPLEHPVCHAHRCLPAADDNTSGRLAMLREPATKTSHEASHEPGVTVSLMTGPA